MSRGIASFGCQLFVDHIPSTECPNGLVYLAVSFGIGRDRPFDAADSGVLRKQCQIGLEHDSRQCIVVGNRCDLLGFRDGIDVYRPSKTAEAEKEKANPV